MSRITKVLAADTPQGVQTVRNVLGTTTDILAAHSMDEAALHLPCADIVLCGVHFDELRMFDLLAYVRGRRDFDDLPFIVYRDLEYALDATYFRSMEIATEALGANGFVDLFALKQAHGIPEADRRFLQYMRERIETAKR